MFTNTKSERSSIMHLAIVTKSRSLFLLFSWNAYHMPELWWHFSCFLRLIITFEFLDYFLWEVHTFTLIVAYSHHHHFICSCTLILLVVHRQEEVDTLVILVINVRVNVEAFVHLELL